MSDWYTNQKKLKLEKILDREQVQGLVEPRVPPDAKYKQQSHLSPVYRPDLTVGKRLIVQLPLPRNTWYDSGPREGYALVVTLDYMERDGYWHSGFTVIGQVVRVSNPKYAEMVGRLISFSTRDSNGSSFPKFVPEEAKLADYKLD